MDIFETRYTRELFLILHCIFEFKTIFSVFGTVKTKNIKYVTCKYGTD